MANPAIKLTKMIQPILTIQITC